MPLVRALTAWSGVVAGDEFIASDDDAQILCAPDLVGGPKAVIVDPQPAPDQPAADAKNPAKNITENIPAPATPEKKGRYMRRDLRAQQ